MLKNESIREVNVQINEFSPLRLCQILKFQLKYKVFKHLGDGTELSSSSSKLSTVGRASSILVPFLTDVS